MSFRQRVLQFQTEKIALWIALRNTLGFALPLAASALVGLALFAGAFPRSSSVVLAGGAGSKPAAPADPARKTG